MRTQPNRNLARMIALAAAALIGATLSGCVGTYAWSDGHSYGAVYAPAFWWGYRSVSYSRHGYGYGGHFGGSYGYGGGYYGGYYGGRHGGHFGGRHGGHGHR